MTREEAIEIIKLGDIYNRWGKDGEEVEKMAIEALKVEPCEDAISRQAVLSMQYRIDDSASLASRDVVNADDIEELPPVTPQQKTGYWIEVIDEVDEYGNKTYHHECSECGSNKSGWGEYNYCPKCGCRMVEPQERSDEESDQTLKDIDRAFKALEERDELLDKIRERIELEKLGYPPSAGYYKAIMKCLQIIDKYRTESEDEDVEYQRQIEQLEHDILYEPTFNPEDGSM